MSANGLAAPPPLVASSRVETVQIYTNLGVMKLNNENDPRQRDFNVEIDRITSLESCCIFGITTAPWIMRYRPPRTTRQL